jgi:hypothetical protein
MELKLKLEIILLIIFIAFSIAVFAYKIGYKFAKRNVLIHLIQKKIITSEQYQNLEEEDI